MLTQRVRCCASRIVRSNDILLLSLLPKADGNWRRNRCGWKKDVRIHKLHAAQRRAFAVLAQKVRRNQPVQVAVWGSLCYPVLYQGTN